MQSRKIVVSSWLAAGVVVALLAAPMAAKEARPPKWSRDVLDAFFDDARDKLSGPRPEYGNRADRLGTDEVSAAAADGETAFGWSKLISTETLESEVKRLSQAVSQTVTTPTAFKGGGYKDARRDFSELAIIFAVTARYDGDARWKDSAAGLRDAFSQAAADAKTGSDETFRAAAACKQDLADLVRGDRPQVSKSDAIIADWSKVAARPPLMQRINIAHQERLTKWLADAATFRRNRGEVAHEAQVVAILANVIHRESFEFADDETYVGYAKDLEQAATDVATAAASGNFNAAREATSRATNACANCHEGYRG